MLLNGISSYVAIEKSALRAFFRWQSRSDRGAWNADHRDKNRIKYLPFGESTRLMKMPVVTLPGFCVKGFSATVSRSRAVFYSRDSSKKSRFCLSPRTYVLTYLRTLLGGTLTILIPYTRNIHLSEKSKSIGAVLINVLY